MYTLHMRRKLFLFSWLLILALAAGCVRQPPQGAVATPNPGQASLTQELPLDSPTPTAESATPALPSAAPISRSSPTPLAATLESPPGPIVTAGASSPQATEGASAALPTLPVSPEQTGSPSPAATQEVLYQDDFEATQGWYTFDGERFRMQYSSAGYVIFNNVTNGTVNSVRTQNYTDVYLEVDASRLAGPLSGYFGLVCRFQDDSSFYALVIGADGSYGIARLLGGQITFITPQTRPSRHIRLGPALNRVGASCIGDTLTLYANGEKLVEVQDATFSSGYIGLVVGTRSSAGVEVLFDNFVVLR
jgi:hypothetical protein